MPPASTVDLWREFGGDAWGSWLLTYELHSFVMYLMTGMLTRVRALPEGSRHRCWQIAILAPVLSSLFSAYLTDGEWTGFVLDIGWRQALPSPLSSAAGLELVTSPVGMAAPYPLAEVHMKTAYRCVLIAWVVVSGLLLSRLALDMRQLMRALRARHPVEDARIIQRFQRLCRCTKLHPRVRLSESSSVQAPLVLGGSEVCVPAEGLQGFTDEEIDSIFAHELAHIERWDWLTLPASALLGAVLWVQPLTPWALTRMRGAGELACDDRAVEWTHDADALASAIALVAERALLQRGLVLTPNVSYAGASPLFRIRRLLARDRAGKARRSLAAGTWIPMALIVLSLLAPAVRLHSITSSSRQLISTQVPLGPVQEADLNDGTSFVARIGELEEQELMLHDRLIALKAQEFTDQSGDSPLLQVEQDLRHAEEERLWLLDRLEGKQYADATK